jgi:hypothetical protein
MIFKLNCTNIILSMFLIALICIIVYKMKEKFIVYDPNPFNNSPMPSPEEQALINKIANDMEYCFNSQYTSTLTATDLTNLTSTFRTTWRDNIINAIKNRLYFDEIRNLSDDSLNLPPTLMRTYYENLIQNLVRNYCSPTNNNYSKFIAYYTGEMSKITGHLACIIKKMRLVLFGISINDTVIDMKELLYQVECVQNYTFNGINNIFADQISFYEKLYDIIFKSVTGYAINFCEDVKDHLYKDDNAQYYKTYRLNAAINKPVTPGCADLSKGFVRPNPDIIPSGIVVVDSLYTTPTRPAATPTPTPTSRSIQTPSSTRTSNTSPAPSSTSPTSTTAPPNGTSSMDENLAPVNMLDNPLDGGSMYENPPVDPSLTSGPQNNSRNTQNNTQNTGGSYPRTQSYHTGPQNMASPYQHVNNFGHGSPEFNYNDGNDSLASFEMQHDQGNISLINAKGPNNFFIPNIWIEE